MTSDSPDHVASVTRYYARNTKKFLRFGENEAYPAIHIALWPEGVERVQEALSVAHQLVAEAIQGHATKVHKVVDLGCGMGAALGFLADHLDGAPELIGLTLGTPVPNSPHILSGRMIIHQADFHQADQVVEECDVAFSIEAVAHSADLDAYLGAVSRLLRAGGMLIILDDFAVSAEAPSHWLKVYRRHWLAPGVLPLDQVTALAARHGLHLTLSRDLTPWIRLGRPRDRLLQWTRPLWGCLAAFSDYAKSLSGGDARQRCLRSGETQFRMLQFTRA